ncbi:MAG: exo-alpha-sialidase [Burkholderiaceae bacterium]
MAALAVGVALACESVRWIDPVAAAAPASSTTALPTGRADLSLTRLSSTHLLGPDDAPRVHASALAVLPGDQMLAFWWAGSRESGPDVQIYSSRWHDGSWTPATALFDRDRLAALLGFGVRRLGNPSAWVSPDGTVNLFVVATGLGGWAASRIVHLTSADRGLHFSVKRILPMSPLFNTSVLVRTSPVGWPDGGWWLPAYFELGNKYSLMLSFDRDGDPRAMTRIGASTSAFQPAVVAVSPDRLHAWMRIDKEDENRIQQAVSDDGGLTWEDRPAMSLVSQYSSMAALRLRDGGFVLLHNDVVAGGEANSRARLRLAVSDDAESWHDGVVVASGEPDDEFSYPSVQQIGDELHVTYTDRRSRIAHHVYRIRYGGAKR